MGTEPPATAADGRPAGSDWVDYGSGPWVQKEPDAGALWCQVCARREECYSLRSCRASALNICIRADYACLALNSGPIWLWRGTSESDPLVAFGRWMRNAHGRGRHIRLIEAFLLPAHKLAVSVSTHTGLTCGASTFAIAVWISGNKFPLELATVGPRSLSSSLFNSVCPFAHIDTTVVIDVYAVAVHLIDFEATQIAVAIRPDVGAESIENAVLLVAFKSITIGKQGNTLPIPQAVLPLTLVAFSIGTDPSSFPMGLPAL